MILALVLGLYVMNTSVKVLRWFTLVKGMGVSNAGWVIVPIFLSSLALNNSTPGKVGGEPVRALMLKEHTDTSISRGIASIFAEKSLDILMILSLAVIGLVYLVIELGFEDVEGMVYAIGIGGILMVVLIGFLFSRRGARMMTDIIGWAADKGSGGDQRSIIFRMAEKVRGSIGKFQESLGNLRKNRYSSTAAVLLTLSIWINEALRLYLIVLALPGDHHVPFLGAVAAISVANILGFILPMGGGNFIGNDSVLLLLTGEKLLSRPASMTAVATSIWISIPLGLISLMYLRKRSRSKDRKEMSD
jgi:uncharacterized protein (TIRG00374 family)